MYGGSFYRAHILTVVFSYLVNLYNVMQYVPILMEFPALCLDTYDGFVGNFIRGGYL